MCSLPHAICVLDMNYILKWWCLIEKWCAILGRHDNNNLKKDTFKTILNSNKFKIRYFVENVPNCELKVAITLFYFLFSGRNRLP